MNNPELPSPAEMQPAARAAEITAILAAAIIRSTTADRPAESRVGLGFLPDQRVHATPYPPEQLS